MTERTKHHLTGNKHAAKDAAEKAEDFLHARVKTSEKAAWVRASKKAKKRSLAEWVIDTLNEHAGDNKQK